MLEQADGNDRLVRLTHRYENICVGIGNKAFALDYLSHAAKQATVANDANEACDFHFLEHFGRHAPFNSRPRAVTPLAPVCCCDQRLIVCDLGAIWEPHPHAAQVDMHTPFMDASLWRCARCRRMLVCAAGNCQQNDQQSSMHNTEAHRGKASGEAGDGFVHGAWTEARLRPCILAAADYRLQRS